MRSRVRNEFARLGQGFVSGRELDVVLVHGAQGDVVELEFAIERGAADA